MTKKTDSAEIFMTTTVSVDVMFGSSALEKIYKFLNYNHVGTETLPFDKYPTQLDVPENLIDAQSRVRGTHRINVEVRVDVNGNLSYHIPR
jgi:hypothetical protein